MDESQSQFDKLSEKIKHNKIIAVIVFLGIVVIGVSTFTNAAKNLMDVLVVEGRPAIDGEWSAQVNYDWPNAIYDETFKFAGAGEEVHGTASFLGKKRGIMDGVVKDNEILFTTYSQELGSDAVKQQMHHYRGKITVDKIRFVMQTEGGFSDHDPVEFNALRITNNSQ